jgi:phage protein U
MRWGPVLFDVVRRNIHEWERSRRADWARHDVVGAVTQLEATGMQPDEMTLRGRIFPFFLRQAGHGSQASNNGMSEIELLRSYCDQQTPQQMIKGTNPGEVLGWYVLEDINDSHTFLDRNATGKIINFEGRFLRFAGKPSAEGFYQSLFGM